MAADWGSDVAVAAAFPAASCAMLQMSGFLALCPPWTDPGGTVMPVLLTVTDACDRTLRAHVLSSYPSSSETLGEQGGFVPSSGRGAPLEKPGLRMLVDDIFDLVLLQLSTRSASILSSFDDSESAASIPVSSRQQADHNLPGKSSTLLLALEP